MKSADDIKHYFRKSTLSTNPDRHEEIFEKILRAQTVSKTTEPVSSRPNIGRILMKNPITKFAIAAIVAIACVIGLSLWRTTGSGIALADVLARMEQVKAFRYQWSDKWSDKMTGEDPNKPYSSEGRGTMLISQEYGSKGKTEDLDPNGRESTFGENYFFPEKKTMIIIQPKQKQYWRIEVDDGYAKKWQNFDPRTSLKKILTSKYESLGRSTIDGIEVEGFRTTDPNWIDNRENKVEVDVKMWVDVKTRLPVRYDSTYVSFDQMGNKKESEHYVENNYQWDVVVDAAEFEPPPIPDDYTSLRMKTPLSGIITEETVIQGLKLLVELLGKYPDIEIITYFDVTILRSAFEKSETPAAMRLKEELKGLTDEEIGNKLVDFLMPIQNLVKFCDQRLFWYDVFQLKYYGKTVTPKDADKVLMRWKVSDNEYRVIYGDLHAETVTPEKLAELEKALPK
jgi:hypothetical protein